METRKIVLHETGIIAIGECIGVAAMFAMLQFSYAGRLAMIFVILFACVKSGLCNVFAIVIPLLFVRPTITIAEFFRKSGD